MTREDVQLLYKDLCGRLPYGVKVTLAGYSGQEVRTLNSQHLNSTYAIEYLGLKPYLRPLSSITDEEKEELLNYVLGWRSMEYFHITRDGSIDGNQEAEQDLYNLNLHWLDFGPLTTSSYIDWLNKNMFDYRGLIPKDLAIKITEKNNPYTIN